jgi:class 3 adenylate cyclase/predicted ATPase
MQQIRDWLKRLGFEQYAHCFAENDIDFSIIHELTDHDLEKIGVQLLGHRLKLLRAIAEIKDVGKNAPAGPIAAPVPALTRPAGDGERRQVTVMFCDLVGSTALSGRMDPEDLREVISAYQRCVAGTVQRFGGFAAKYMGDGVLVYFGYPEAHEDDAERAVQAGLKVVTAVKALKTNASLQTRVGIATGLVIVADRIGAGAAQEQTVIGETPNLAARLQGIAEPNTVVVAESTRRLLGNLFDLEDLGAKHLKGIDEPVQTWAALRASSAASRFEALHATGLTALVGREEEFDLLIRRWSKAKTGEGRVVLLFGEAGIGKSRLTAALLERLAAEPHTRLRYFCSPQHSDSPLSPIIGQMERAAGLAHDDMPQARLDKLDAVLALSSTSIQDAALLAEMLSLPNDGRYPTIDLTPQLRRQKTLEVIISQLERLARQSPMLMILEDAQWIDPTSLELFGLMVERIKTLRVLLIVTFRPEFKPPWIGPHYVTVLTINRLAQREVGAMIDSVVGGRVLPEDVRQDIIQRTDGIPLFVEEMTKAVLEAESENQARRTAAAIPSPALGIPASLHASLMARLDRLGQAKEVAQVGAAIGREFSHALLAALMRGTELELGLALDRLIQAGLLFRQGMPPGVSYLFKHALVQDAAYGTLLREPRRALHARIGQVLESQFADVAESQPELLARHCTEAGLIEKAAGLWGKAGQRALSRSALVEAAAQLTRALAQTASLPSTTDLLREQITFQVGLTTALMHTKGYAAPETKASLERARELIERAEAVGEPPEDSLLLFSILYGFWAANFVAFNGDAMCELAAQFLVLAEKQRASVPLMIGHRLLGTSLMFTGSIAQSRIHYDEAIALYDPAEHRPLATRFSQDVGVTILSLRSLSLWLLGYPDDARTDTERALKNAGDIGQAGTLMYALTNAALIHIHCRDFATARTVVDELAALATEKGALYWKGYGMMLQGCVLALAGSATNAVQMITSGIITCRSTGSTAMMPWYLSKLATAYADIGNFDEAWRCIGEAMRTVETTKESWCVAEINRVAGEIAVMSSEPDTAKAEPYFQRALEIARTQQARSWELRAVMSMTRLWRDQGKRKKARNLLAPMYCWFTEGFDTLDLKEAKIMLDELVV